MQSPIAAGDFKARCLKLIDEVAQTREPLLITKRGRPVAQVVPVPAEPALFGSLAGTVLHEGDLIAPIGDDWDACR